MYCYIEGFEGLYLTLFRLRPREYNFYYAVLRTYRHDSNLYYTLSRLGP